MSKAGLRARIGKQTAIYGLGLLAGRALSFISLPIYTRLLTPADYGVIQLIEMTFDMLTILAGQRIGQGVFRFYHKVSETEDRNAVLTTALVLLFSTFSVIAIGAWMSAEALSKLIFNSTEYVTAIRVAALSFPWGGMMGVTLGYLRLRDRAMTFVLIGLAKSIIQLVCVLLLLGVYGMDLTGVFIGTLVANTIVGSGLLVNMLRKTGIRFSSAAAKDLYRFGLPLVVTQVATFLTTFGDRYFLQNAVGETEVGIYALAYSFGFLLFQLGYGGFAQVWGPVRFEVAKLNDPSPALSRTFIVMNVLMATVAVGIGVFVDDMLRIMSPAEYWRAARLVPLILVAYYLQGWSAFLDLGILVQEKTRYITYANWAAALVAGVGYTFAIPIYGAWGAAGSTVAAFALRAVMIHHFSQKLWPVRYDWGPVFRVMALAVVTVAVGESLPQMRLIPSIAVRSLLIGVYALALWHSRIIPPPEKELLWELIRHPRRSYRRWASDEGLP